MARHADASELTRQVRTDATGRAELSFPGPGPQVTREVEAIMVRVANTSAVPFAFIYTGEARDENLWDGTSNGDFDRADYPRSLRIPGDKPLVVEWRDADADVLCTARIQYVDLQGGS